jgi:hypothetical protein
MDQPMTPARDCYGPASGTRPACARVLFGAPSRDELDHFFFDQGMQVGARVPSPAPRGGGGQPGRATPALRDSRAHARAPARPLRARSAAAMLLPLCAWRIGARRAGSGAGAAIRPANHHRARRRAARSVAPAWRSRARS